MRTTIMIGLLVGMLGCGDNGAASVTCAPCGNGDVECTGPISDCIAAGTCETHQAGNIALNADGTYAQEGGGGTYSVSPSAVLLVNEFGVTSVLGVAVGSCPLAADQ